MKLERVEIENYRAIEKLDLPLDPALTVFHGANGHGKTSVLGAIAAGLGSIPALLPEVSGVGFLKTDRRGPRPLRVMLRTRDGIEWERRLLGPQKTSGPRSSTGQRSLKEAMEAIVAADREEAEPLDLLIVAFYDTDRAVFDAPHPRRNLKTAFPRYAALEGALSPRPNFREFFKWFYALENEELREKKEQRDWDYQLPELKAVRKAIVRMAPGVSDPRIRLRPLRFTVSVESEAGKPEELALDQLSGGYRIVLALAADLARRMAQGNPHHQRLAETLAGRQYGPCGLGCAARRRPRTEKHGGRPPEPLSEQNPCPWNQRAPALAGYHPLPPLRRKPSPVHALGVNPD